LGTKKLKTNGGVFYFKVGYVSGKSGKTSELSAPLKVTIRPSN
jgi:hypothetical protein